MVGASIACAVVASSPRDRRVALLPVLGAKLTSSAIALSAFAWAPKGSLASPWRALATLFVLDFALFLASALLYRQGAPGVHLSRAPTQTAPEEVPAAESPAPVRLTVGRKSS